MPFDKIEVLVRGRRSGMPASVTLSSIKGSRPRCIVGLSAAFLADFAIGEKERFAVLLGCGAEKHLLRFKRDKTGVVAPRMMMTGRAVTFNLGFIERFGTEPEKKQFCQARIVDKDTIEITLPRWSAEIDA
jgi:hypothetical protein